MSFAGSVPVESGVLVVRRDSTQYVVIVGYCDCVVVVVVGVVGVVARVVEVSWRALRR